MDVDVSFITNVIVSFLTKSTMLAYKFCFSCCDQVESLGQWAVGIMQL